MEAYKQMQMVSENTQTTVEEGMGGMKQPKTFKSAEEFIRALDGKEATFSIKGDKVNVTMGRAARASFDLSKGKGSMSEEVDHESEILDEKKLDPVDDKANDKKFKNRKDKDIDNDGDVDSSDEFLHKKRKAIDNEIDGGEKPAKKEEKEDEEEVDSEEDKGEDKKKKKKIAKPDSDKVPEISKIGEAILSTMRGLEKCQREAKQKQTKDALPPEKFDDKESPKSKEFIAKHKIDVKKHDDMEVVEKPKKRTIKKEDVSEYEVIRAILSGTKLGE